MWQEMEHDDADCRVGAVYNTGLEVGNYGRAEMVEGLKALETLLATVLAAQTATTHTICKVCEVLDTTKWSSTQVIRQ